MANKPPTEYYNDAMQYGGELIAAAVEAFSGFVNMNSVNGPKGRGNPLEVAQQKEIGGTQIT